MCQVKSLPKQQAAHQKIKREKEKKNEREKLIRVEWL